MAFALSKVPRGLLELLNARTTGKTLNASQEFLQPTLDQREFYASSMLFGSAGTSTVGAITAAGISSSLTFTTTLGIKAIGGGLTIGAAAATNVVVSWGVNCNNVGIPLGSVYVANAAAGQVVLFGGIVPNWVLPAGIAGCFVNATGTAAGADHAILIRTLIENYTQQG